MLKSHVDLGFIEKGKDWLLKSNLFPSKVGGKPAWLDLSNLPKNTDLQCSKCTKLMTFLCQIYSPDEDKEDCFHRTIFLFVCRNEKCCIRNDNSNLIAFRSQLKRTNAFYSSDPPNEEKESDWNIENYVKLCVLCGAFADKHCSNCKIASYCCREHQIIDWKAIHKAICGRTQDVSSINSFLFDEFEIVMEIENKMQIKETPEEAEKRRLKEFNELEIKGELGTMQDCLDLNEYAAEIDEDKAFAKFQEKISLNPGQILRYQRGASPLWIANDPKPKEIPNCENCSSERIFEFQILPQLLYHLHEDKLDWGILCVYTCKNNCSTGNSYKKEFIFKQDVTIKDI